MSECDCQNRKASKMAPSHCTMKVVERDRLQALAAMVPELCEALERQRILAETCTTSLPDDEYGAIVEQCDADAKVEAKARTLLKEADDHGE